MAKSGESGVALLVGAGDAIGAAVARRFAAGGYSVCVARRDPEKSRSVVREIISAGGTACAVGTDVRSEEAVQALFAQVEAELGPVEVCLFNAGANVKSPLSETSARLFFKAWKLACWRLSDRPRRGTLHGAAWPRHDPVYRRHRQRSRRVRLRRVCGGEVRPARSGTVHGA